MRYNPTFLDDLIAGTPEDGLARSLAFDLTADDTAPERWYRALDALCGPACEAVLTAHTARASTAELAIAYRDALYERTMAAWPAVEPTGAAARELADAAGALGRVA